MISVNPKERCAACGSLLGDHLLSQFITCRAKLGLMPSLLEMFPPKNEKGQYSPMGIVWAIIALIMLLAILRAFGII